MRLACRLYDLVCAHPQNILYSSARRSPERPYAAVCGASRLGIAQGSAKRRITLSTNHVAYEVHRVLNTHFFVPWTCISSCLFVIRTCNGMGVQYSLIWTRSSQMTNNADLPAILRYQALRPLWCIWTSKIFRHPSITSLPLSQTQTSPFSLRCWYQEIAR